MASERGKVLIWNGGGNARVALLRHALVRPVPGLEVQVRGPVVREILRERTRGAVRHGRDILSRHRSVERVAANDLMDVGTRYGAGIDEPGSQERDVVSQLCLYTRACHGISAGK